jgi:hypothetical protein
MPNSKSPEQALQMITKAAEEVAANLVLFWSMPILVNRDAKLRWK